MKKFVITGDTHGMNISRVKGMELKEDEAVIILGDAGFNFYLNKTDYKNKTKFNEMNIDVYCVRGNHEERPENIGAIKVYDEEIKGEVWIEPEFPHIHYFIDGGTYEIEGQSVLVLGGAYSVDKFYRLSHFAPDAKWTGWFKDEQLTKEEREDILNKVAGAHFDIILSHTCPVDWEPTDLFLNSINQSKVDKTMELWLQDIKESVDWGIWLFGHFHADRLVRPGAEMYYTDSEHLSNIIKRWMQYKSDGSLDWWLVKDSMFYAT